MGDFRDYEVTIEDLEPYKSKEVTKSDLIRVINERLSKQWSSQQDRTIGIEIDVRPEWKKILREDGSILWDYHELGWKAMHYEKRNQKGKIIREWLSFKHPRYKGIE